MSNPRPGDYTRADFVEFLTVLREVVRRRANDPKALEIDEAGDHAALPMPNGTWHPIDRANLTHGDGTMVEMAEVVHDCHLEDCGLKPYPW